MPCFRAPYPTLQSVFRHYSCVIVVVGNQGLAVEQVIGTQTDGICFLAVLALTVRLLFLGFAPFTRHDGNNGCTLCAESSRPCADVRQPHCLCRMWLAAIGCCRCTIHRVLLFPVCSSCPRAYPTRPPERHGLDRV